jgi:hypothetical protein
MEVYDLTLDASEKNNIASMQFREAEIRARLAAWVQYQEGLIE